MYFLFFFLGIFQGNMKFEYLNFWTLILLKTKKYAFEVK